MKVGDRMVGTEGKRDYVCIGVADDHFFLGVKPIISYMPHVATFGFGLRFRAVSDLPGPDPEIHCFVWSKIPFVNKKPTHASVGVMLAGCHASHLLQAGGADKLIEFLEGDKMKLFDHLTKFVVDTLDENNTEGLKRIEPGAITVELRKIMHEKLSEVEAEMQAGKTPESTDVDLMDEIEAFMQSVEGKKGNGGGGMVH